MLIGVDASRATVARRTGTENYALCLIRALLDIGAQHTWRLYWRDEPPAGLVPAPGPLGDGGAVEWCVMPFPRLWTHARLGWELLADPPDVLFVPAHVLPLISGVPSVVTVHDLGYLHWPSAHALWDRAYLRLSTRHSAMRARRIIADSLATRDDLVRYLSVPVDRIAVAYPGGRPEMRRVPQYEARALVKERYGIHGRYLLFLGSLHPRKNIVRLVRAFTSLVERGMLEVDVSLVLAGKRGWLFEQMDGAIRDAQSVVGPERIQLLGYVPDGDLSALLSGALAFLLPSLYEGFGLPLLEAMACETPVICSNVSSLPEVAGDAALMVDPLDTEGLAQAIQRVASDASLRSLLVARGRDRVAQFSWAHCARTVLSVIEEAAA